MDGGHVEEENESDKYEHGGDQTDPEKDQLPPPVIDAKGDEGHDGVGDEEAEDETEEMCVVVDPGQQAGEEEDGGDANQLEDRHLGILETWPLVDHLHDAGGEKPEVRPSRSNLCSVGHKDGAGQVADHPGAQVDDPDPLGAGHLLKVSHQPVLEWEFNIVRNVINDNDEVLGYDGDEEMEDAGVDYDGDDNDEDNDDDKEEE